MAEKKVQTAGIEAADPKDPKNTIVKGSDA